MPVCPAAPVCACARPGCRRPRRYPSDTTDAEWALIAPLLPVPACQTPAGGRPETHCRRAVVDAIRYVIHNGCVWRALPADFPPWRTVYGLYQRWNAAGCTIALHDALRAAARQAAGRNAEPTAAVIDSQSVRAAPTVPTGQPGLGQRQEGQRPQTPHRRRHQRPAAGGPGHSRQRARPRRRPAAAVQPAPRPPPRPPRLGRRRLRRETAALGGHLPQAHRRDRQTAR